jgi:hypothetical protein
MGIGSSKIPSPPPGQILKFIGIKDLDKIYDLFEIYVRSIDHIRTEVDLRFTDFIKSLGAAKLWEIYNNFPEILKMYFLVLAIHRKGEITYSNEGPLEIRVNKKLFPSYVKKLIETFEEYHSALKKCKNKLTRALQGIKIGEIERSMRRSRVNNESSHSFDSFSDSNQENNELTSQEQRSKIEMIKKHVDWIYDNAVFHLQQEKYSPIDMITAIEIIDKNNKVILKTCESIELYRNLEEKFIEETRKVLQEATTPQRKDKMIQQVAQAVHEKIFVPCEIVSYFWPYPDR